MRLLSSLLAVVAAHRTGDTGPDTSKFALSSESVPEFDKYNPDEGIIPAFTPKQGESFQFVLKEHTNFFKTSEYSFQLAGVNNDMLQNPTEVARFHTYLLGKSADLLLKKTNFIAGGNGNRRLFRVTSHRHGNAFKNYKEMIFFVKDGKNKVYATVVRHRLKAYGMRSWFGKIITHSKRKHAQQHDETDVYIVKKGECALGTRDEKDKKCGKVIMTGVAPFKGWNMYFFQGKAPKLGPRDVVGDSVKGTVAEMKMFENKLRVSLHHRQIFSINVEHGGDGGMVMIIAMLRDITMANERFNLQMGHNFWNMDM